ncbi:TPA: hypothetical protein ACX6QF_003138 [Photobacterium damselae]|uniref:hypothetical protein n=1 Tax=Photobacterium damselae TaxID=38293 RepID=UPI001593828D|nr:hypothetical protein [Photobacterium damselae]MCG3826598.1 hypothetical protein [Photobacterium damselae]NVH47098.1 hypothetical protein [Photobacterium damselae subsp. damselae]
MENVILLNKINDKLLLQPEIFSHWERDYLSNIQQALTKRKVLSDKQQSLCNKLLSKT